MSIDKFRNHIDSIDGELIALLAQRIEIVKEIAAFKLKRSLPVLDAQRENVIMERITHADVQPDDAVVRVYKEIISQSRRVQIEEIARSVGGE